MVKSRPAPIVEQRVRYWVRCADYLWLKFFEAADVVSEGAIRVEGVGRVYYGSTHIRLLHAAFPGNGPLDTAEGLERIARADPHVRVRAIRLACLEAQIRSGAEFDSVRTELAFLTESRALRISVDVEAHLSIDSALSPRQTRSGRLR